jgi:hypothetical protein
MAVSIHTINRPLDGWIQGEKFTNGKQIFIVAEVWFKGFNQTRFIFVESETKKRYEYSAADFAKSIIEEKIYKI